MGPVPLFHRYHHVYCEFGSPPDCFGLRVQHGSETSIASTVGLEVLCVRGLFLGCGVKSRRLTV